ncbi:MAG: hypothetical protein V3R94_09645, partial [Acidobacteriota bacterium]
IQQLVSVPLSLIAEQLVSVPLSGVWEAPQGAESGGPLTERPLHFACQFIGGCTAVHPYKKTRMNLQDTWNVERGRARQGEPVSVPIS